MDAVLSVSEYLKLATEVLRLNIQSGAFAIEGELSGLTIKDGKWMIFSLKDENEANMKLKCFATTYKIVGSFEDGMRVRIYGAPSITKWSDFQVNVERMEPVGEGALKRAYDLLKKKLEDEGLFNVARKRSLPRFPERIGLITSSDAAAYGDFLRILNNRWGGVQVTHVDVRVQGESAVDQILQAFETLASLPEEKRPEVIVLTRGGGSLEDLHAFNDERVARAVYASTIPVICGVGHERDESLCDFVADVRASTPSNAAERVVPDRREILHTLSTIVDRLTDRVEQKLTEQQRIIETVTRVMGHFMANQGIRLEATLHRLLMGSSGWTTRLRTRLESSERLLKSLDPTRVLARGYAIVKVGSKVIKDASTVALGEEIEVRFAKGKIYAKKI